VRLREDRGGERWMEDVMNPEGRPPGRRLRVAFTESNIFAQGNRIPEDEVFTRSTSVPRGNCRASDGDACKVGSWRSSLESSITRPLKNSFSLGFLFPDDDDDDDESSDELLQSLISGESDEKEALLESAKKQPHRHRSYGSLDGRSAAGDLECGGFGFTSSCVEDAAKPGRNGMHRAQTAPAMACMSRERKAGALKRPQFAKGSAIVRQAGIGLTIYLAFGIAIYAWKNQDFSGIETFRVVDALYFCVVTMCTIGYGDIVPVTPFAKLFVCLFVLIGFSFIDALLSGMVTYVLDKQEHLLLSAVEGSHYRTAKKYFLNAKHGNRLRIRMKVAMALGVPVVCIMIGTLVMMKLEDLALLDAFYCTTMSVTTVGYGDHTFKTYSGRLFAGVWLLFSTLAVARCFLYLAEARIDKRHRMIAKWVLQRELTVGDLVQADLDHDGCIR
jgi:potassium channel subfamily K